MMTRDDIEYRLMSTIQSSQNCLYEYFPGIISAKYLVKVFCRKLRSISRLLFGIRPLKLSYRTRQCSDGIRVYVKMLDENKNTVIRKTVKLGELISKLGFK